MIEHNSKLTMAASEGASQFGEDFEQEWEPLLTDSTKDDMTGRAIAQCKRYFINPYKVWLVCVGWDDYNESPSRSAKIFRCIWAMVFFIILNCTLVTQIISCFRRDQPPHVNVMHNETTGKDEVHIKCGTSLGSIFVIPDILLILTYVYGLLLFSRGDSDYLHKLSGEVFVQCINFKRWWSEPKPTLLIFTVLLFLVLAAAYTIFSLLVRIMYAFAFELFKDNVMISWPSMIIQGEVKVMLLVFSLVGFVFLDMVYCVAIINYAAQCELNIYFLHAVKLKVEERQYSEVDEAIKDIGKSYNFLKTLNGRTASLTGLILFNVASTALGGIIKLSYDSESSFKIAVVTFNTILWLLLVAFPFVQAARVTNACNEVLATGPLLRRRPFLYQESSQVDLDSYCQFTNSIILRAEMLGIPIYPWMAYFVVVTFSFTLLILWQTGAYSYTIWL